MPLTFRFATFTHKYVLIGIFLALGSVIRNRIKKYNNFTTNRIQILNNFLLICVLNRIRACYKQHKLDYDLPYFKVRLYYLNTYTCWYISNHISNHLYHHIIIWILEMIYETATSHPDYSLVEIWKISLNPDLLNKQMFFLHFLVDLTLQILYQSGAVTAPLGKKFYWRKFKMAAKILNFVFVITFVPNWHRDLILVANIMFVRSRNLFMLSSISWIHHFILKNQNGHQNLFFVITC